MGKKDFKGRVVWITGASSGIGRACAMEFARRGARVALSARNKEKLTALRNEIGPKRSIAIPLDVTDREANHTAVETVMEEFGALDIAFLNAGMYDQMDLEDFNAQTFVDHMNVNYNGMIYGIEAALPALRKSDDPLLVGMSSSVAYRGFPRGEAYCASKAAIRNMLQGFRIQLRKINIPVTIICPGFVKSELTAKNQFEMPFLMEAKQAARVIADGVALKRHEIAFPWQFILMMKLMTLLPSTVYTKMMYRQVFGK